MLRRLGEKDKRVCVIGPSPSPALPTSAAFRQHRCTDCVRACPSIIQTSEGGYLFAGNLDNSISLGTCCTGGLLLKLDANGVSQWQKAYHAGVHCFSNGFNTTCQAIDRARRHTSGTTASH
jgi:hypothetical protein